MIMDFQNSIDTIVAPMTPMGVSAVAALRVSGPKVREVVKALFGESAEKNLKARRAELSTARFRNKKIIDSLLYIYFEGPHSYTGEDVLELYPHGNPLIVKDLIEAIRQAGARLAEPGEYTRRAFLNGKMDLAQAESVADVIHSANRAELDNAHKLLSGALSKKVAELANQVKDISARLELDVDFAEEEADPDYSGWSLRFENIKDSIQNILENFKGKAQLRKIPLAVFYGAPNAGKSSLVNALLGEDRLLVSNIPGTTRDFVEVRLFLEGGEIRLVDTAGIAEVATDELDALSMKKSKQILEEADLKILLVDSSEKNYKNLVAESTQNIKPDFVVYTKGDLAKNLNENLQVSSKTKVGISQLKQLMNKTLFKETSNPEDLWITSEREKVCLEEALLGVNRSLDLLKNNPAVELLAFEMQLVRRSLLSITGEISSEDVLQSIFAGFCIGK